MIASIIIGIISRYFLRSPIIWVEEINNYLLLVWAFLPAAWVLSIEGHVVIDTVLQSLDVKKQNVMHAVSSLLSFLYFVTLLWISGKWTWESLLESSRFDSMLGPPKFLILMFIPVGSLLLAVQCIRRAVHHISLAKADRMINER
jgi:TRAP-type C4-dicarboxylate transport system permease small subunit